MENKYIIKEAELNENVYDEDGVVVGTIPCIKYVVYDKTTDTPITQFDYECEAIKWCNDHEPK